MRKAQSTLPKGQIGDVGIKHWGICRFLGDDTESWGKQWELPKYHVWKTKYLTWIKSSTG